MSQREIMLFIKKPMGRSMMISNVTSFFEKMLLTNLNVVTDVALVDKVKKTFDSEGRMLGLNHTLFVTPLLTEETMIKKGELAIMINKGESI